MRKNIDFEWILYMAAIIRNHIYFFKKKREYFVVFVSSQTR